MPINLPHSVRHDLLLIEQMLDEGQQYEQMFTDILRVAPTAKNPILKKIKWAKKVLQKLPRVVWYLRWYRLALLMQLAKKPKKATPGEPPPPDFAAMFKKALADYNQRAGAQYNETHVDALKDFDNYADHWFSLPIAGIQNFDPKFIAPGDFDTALLEIEHEWQEKQQQEFAPDDDIDQPILKFNDGFAWYHLQRSSCREEGRAMGHCGNTASPQPGDTILSLRHDVMRPDGQRYVRPVCTFILHENGYLGEMKGRANKKPIAEYHKYIIPLLRLDMINGIEGAGYAPDENFSVFDLPENIRHQLLAENPDLMSLSDKLHHGDDRQRSEAVMSLRARLSDNNIQPPMLEYDAKEKAFIVAQWDDLEDFVTDVNDDAVGHLLDLYDSNNRLTNGETSKDLIYMAYDLPDQYQQMLLTRAGVSSTGVRRRDIPLAINQLLQKKDSIVGKMRQAFKDMGVSSIILNRISEYINASWAFECGQAYVVFSGAVHAGNVESMLGKPINLCVQESDLMMYSAPIPDADPFIDPNDPEPDESDEPPDEDRISREDYEQGMYEAGYDFETIRRNGWSGLSSESTNEHRRDEGLTDRDGNDRSFLAKRTGDDDESMFRHAAKVFVDILHGRTREPAPTIRDPRQGELALDQLDQPTESTNPMRNIINGVSNALSRLD